MDIEKGTQYGTVTWYVYYEMRTRSELDFVEIYCGAWQIMRHGRLATGCWAFCKMTSCIAWSDSVPAIILERCVFGLGDINEQRGQRTVSIGALLFAGEQLRFR
jgi:hypothetical protein